MKEKSGIANRIYTVCFLGLMVLFGVASVIRSPAGTGRQFKKVSFLQQYPFAEGWSDTSAEHAENGTAASEKVGLGSVGEYRSLIYRTTDAIEQRLTAHNPLASPLKKTAYTINGFLGGDVVVTDSSVVVKLQNGSYTECFSYCPSYEVWNSIYDFSVWLKEKNIPFVSLITPDKSDDSITVFPENIPHGYTQTIEEYKAFMDEKNISYIETKKLLLAENNDFYAWFYRTDHHWNVHAAFLTARKTAEYLTDTLSVPADRDALSEDRFEIAAYPDSFLGSFGRIFGEARKDDMEVLYPKEETDFHIEIPGYDIDKTGEFADTLIDQSRLDAAGSLYNAFLYRDCPIIRIENNNCQNSTRILVIKHSFANALCPYLAGAVRYLDLLDPGSFDGSIRSYIEQTNPDVVLFCMDVAIEEYKDSLRLK